MSTAARIVVYATPWCPYCVRAKRLLDAKQVSYQLIDVDAEPQRRQEMMQLSGRRTVPQIFINDEHIGGCDDLYALERQQQLDEKLQRHG